MEYKFFYANEIHTVRIEKESDKIEVEIDNKESFDIKEMRIQDNSISIYVNGKLKNLYLAKDKNKIYVAVDGEYFLFEQEKSGAKTRETVVAQKGNSVASPMPGLLVKLPVKVGDKVNAGDILAIVEAMKMQNELRSPIPGVVKKINYKEGVQIDAFVPIVELESI
ncbi:MAG: biotin/lipoyl-containing protein [bacterium]